MLALLSARRAGTELCAASRAGLPTTRALSTVQLDVRKGDRERVVILGSGWAGFTLAQRLDKTRYQPVIISPRSYFVFTPLLASTAVGTLEFRNAIESVRGRGRGVEYYQGWGDEVDFVKRTVTVEENATEPYSTAPLPGDYVHPGMQKGKKFELQYDKLVIAVGCYSQTFNTPGVRQHALFLKDVGDARAIRKRILDCFEKAALPATPESVKRQLLHFAVVGGGPTGVEFSAELFDLCNEDLKRLYPSLIGYVKITIFDVASTILSMFDKNLSDYALHHFRRDGINIQTEHHILELRPGLPKADETDQNVKEYGEEGFTLKTKEEGEIGIGMCVWSTGLMMNPFVQKLTHEKLPYPGPNAILEPSKDLNKQRNNGKGSGNGRKKSPALLEPESTQWQLKRNPKSGALVTCAKFRLQLVAAGDTAAHDDHAHDMSRPEALATLSDVFALGDVATPPTGALPATAQVASQEAIWLATRLNKGDIDAPYQQGFQWKNLGMMAYLGGWRGIFQTGGGSGLRGWLAWVVWRGAYLTKTIGWRNKLLIPIYWMVNWVFGRDISRF